MTLAGGSEAGFSSARWTSPARQPPSRGAGRCLASPRSFSFCPRQAQTLRHRTRGTSSSRCQSRWRHRSSSWTGGGSTWEQREGIECDWFEIIGYVCKKRLWAMEGEGRIYRVMGNARRNLGLSHLSFNLTKQGRVVLSRVKLSLSGGKWGRGKRNKKLATGCSIWKNI